MLTNFKNSRPQQFSFLFIVFLLLYFLVPENENSLLWRLPPLLKDIPLLINTLLDNLMFKWLTIPVYDPDWQMYEDKPIFRIITRSIADFLLFLIIFIREIFLGGLQTKGKFIDQVIRPTGLIDPNVEIRPAKNQVDDLMHECKKVVEKNFRVLVTTLTKKMAEDLTEYLHENGIKVRYLHSDIDTLERIEIMRDLRMGVFDVLVGINLLREGLDIPECALVGILDADKEGFLRSETSLIQTIGRAARNVDGKVILYADKETKSIKKAIAETDRRRQIQVNISK